VVVAGVITVGHSLRWSQVFVATLSWYQA